MKNETIHRKVMKYAIYTVLNHSSESEDLHKLNEIFRCNISLDDVLREIGLNK